MSHDRSLLCSPRCINFILPFNPDAPTNYEMATFVQMVTHALQCRFSNCYLTSGSLNCRSVKEAVRHCHQCDRSTVDPATGERCLCQTCQSFGKLYARHLHSCRLPIGQCPFAVCDILKRRLRLTQHQRPAQPQAAPDSTGPNSPQGENASAQEPNNEIRQNLNVDVASQNPTSTNETLQHQAREGSSSPER